MCHLKTLRIPQCYYKYSGFYYKLQGCWYIYCILIAHISTSRHLCSSRRCFELLGYTYIYIYKRDEK